MEFYMVAMVLRQHCPNPNFKISTFTINWVTKIFEYTKISIDNHKSVKHIVEHIVQERALTQASHGT